MCTMLPYLHATEIDAKSALRIIIVINTEADLTLQNLVADSSIIPKSKMRFA